MKERTYDAVVEIPQLRLRVALELTGNLQEVETQSIEVLEEVTPVGDLATQQEISSESLIPSEPSQPLEALEPLETVETISTEESINAVIKKISLISKISTANKSPKIPKKLPRVAKYKVVQIDNLKYESISVAAKRLNITTGQVRSLLVANGYSMESLNRIESITIESALFPSAEEAGRALDCLPGSISTIIRRGGKVRGMTVFYTKGHTLNHAIKSLVSGRYYPNHSVAHKHEQGISSQDLQLEVYGAKYLIDV